MNSQSNVVQRLGNIIVFLILLMPIVRYYNVPGTDVGSNSAITLALCLLTPIAVLYNRNYISVLVNVSALKQSRYYFVFFFVWSILITLYYEYGGLASGNFNNAIVAFLSCFVMAMLLTGKIDSTGIFKLYSFLVYVVLAILFVQWLFSLAGIYLDFRLPFHEFNGSWKFADGINFGMEGTNTSVFSEPAHIAEFLIPFLCYSLFGTNRSKKGMQMAIITTIAVGLTISGTGIVLLGFVWLLYFTIFSDKKGSNKYLIGVIGIIAIVVLFLTLQALEDYNTMLGKLFLSSDGSLEGNKSSFRLYRGWDYVFKMPFMDLITGVGFVHMEKFAGIHGIWSVFDNEYKIFEWFSGITEVLLYFGIIGTIPFVIHIIKLYKRQTNLTKSLVIVFVSLLFTSQILFQETHFFYLSLIIGSIQYSDKNNGKKQIAALA